MAAERGHAATQCESSQVLGGQGHLAQLLPGRSEHGGITTNLTHELKRAGVAPRLGVTVTGAMVESESPVAVILATGARPYMPEIEGMNEAHFVTAWQVLQGKANVGPRVAIADWRCDWVGLGLAELLARKGCQVRLAVNGITAGHSIPQHTRDTGHGDPHRLGVEIIPYDRLFGAGRDTAFFQHTLGGEPIVLDGVDTVVTSLGHRPVTDLADNLETWDGEVTRIGDCLAHRTVEEAVLEGLRIGARI